MHIRHGIIAGLLFWSVVAYAYAQDVPKVEISGAYSYVRANQISVSGCCFHMNGGSGSVALNANHWFSIVGEVGGYHSGNVNNTRLDLNVISYLIGPRISLRSSSRITPFGQILVGGGHASGTLYSGSAASSGLGTQNGFAATVGGGIDVGITKRVAIRLVEADYFVTRFQNGSNNHQNNLRISAGLVFRFGKR